MEQYTAFMVWKTLIFYDFSHSKLIRSIQYYQSKSQQAFIEINKLLLKFVWKYGRRRMANTILKKQNNNAGSSETGEKGEVVILFLGNGDISMKTSLKMNSQNWRQK